LFIVELHFSFLELSDKDKIAVTPVIEDCWYSRITVTLMKFAVQVGLGVRVRVRG
jgi:hypothetical protein